MDLRAGRIDATEANTAGVPQPFQDLDSHVASFARQGFTQEEMISLVACGHTFGGVQHSAFPDTVPAQDGVDDVDATFDSTPFNFDNDVYVLFIRRGCFLLISLTSAAEYIQGTTMNPLVVGHNDTTNSDKRIFSSDGNKTMSS